MSAPALTTEQLLRGEIALSAEDADGEKRVLRLLDAALEAAALRDLSPAKRMVLAAARRLAQAQASVEAALDAWMGTADPTPGGRYYHALATARRSRNDAADHLYDVASMELAAEIAGKPPG